MQTSFAFLQPEGRRKKSQAEKEASLQEARQSFQELLLMYLCDNTLQDNVKQVRQGQKVLAFESKEAWDLESPEGKCTAKQKAQGKPGRIRIAVYFSGDEKSNLTWIRKDDPFMEERPKPSVWEIQQFAARYRVTVVKTASLYGAERMMEDAAIYGDRKAPIWWNSTLYPCLNTVRLTNRDDDAGKVSDEMLLVSSPGVRLIPEEDRPSCIHVITVLFPRDSILEHDEPYHNTEDPNRRY